MPNDAFKGTWRDYLHPEAVNAYSQGKDFTPANQKQLSQANFNNDDIKSLKTFARKNHLDSKDFEKKNLYKLAKNEGKTLSQLKAELVNMGVLK
jgi:hypothetical protein